MEREKNKTLCWALKPDLWIIRIPLNTLMYIQPFLWCDNSRILRHNTFWHVTSRARMWMRILLKTIEQNRKAMGLDIHNHTHQNVCDTTVTDLGRSFWWHTPASFALMCVSVDWKVSSIWPPRFGDFCNPGACLTWQNVCNAKRHQVSRSKLTLISGSEWRLCASLQSRFWTTRHIAGFQELPNASGVSKGVYALQPAVHSWQARYCQSMFIRTRIASGNLLMHAHLLRWIEAYVLNLSSKPQGPEIWF